MTTWYRAIISSWRKEQWIEEVDVLKVMDKMLLIGPRPGAKRNRRVMKESTFDRYFPTFTDAAQFQLQRFAEEERAACDRLNYAINRRVAFREWLANKIREDANDPR